MTELGVPIRRQLQQSSRERVQEVKRAMAASLVRNLRIEVTDAFELEISSLACFFVGSFESRMNPRFLAEAGKGIL